MPKSSTVYCTEHTDPDRIVIAVCGDSFCAASRTEILSTPTGARAHFSQMLEDQWGYQILHLAHGGFSNVAIWFQIRQAILAKVHVVVYNTTWSHRVELIVREKFRTVTGIGNFFYYDPHCVSTGGALTGDSSASVLSTTPHGIDQSPFFSVTPEQRQAVDLYLKHMYNDELHTELDSWMFEYWHEKIIKARILPIKFRQPCIGECAYHFSEANPGYDTPFHTDRATQQQIAENIHRYVVDNLHKLC